MTASDWVHLDVAVIAQESDKALKLVLKDGRIAWIPLSQISESQDYKAGMRNITVSVTEWIAREKGLLDESK